MKARRLAAVGLFGYGVLVLFLVLWPSHVDAGVAPELSLLLKVWHTLGMPGFIDYDLIEISANVLMFVPLGLFLAVLLGTVWYLAVPALLVFSFGIELTQQLALPGRTASGLDVLANTLGAVLGVCVFLILLRRKVTAGKVLESVR